LLVVLNSEDFGDWSYFPKVWQTDPEVLVVGFAIYIIGQATLWALLLWQSFFKIVADL
jgi:hypothetical protein